MAEKDEPKGDVESAVDLQLDAASPKGSSGGQDPRALDAPVKPNGGHVLGLTRPD